MPSPKFAFPKLHNAMWPGLVGKGDGPDQEPPISLERMLDLTAAANVGGQKFEGIDYFLFLPHTNPEAKDDELKKIADLIAMPGDPFANIEVTGQVDFVMKNGVIYKSPDDAPALG